MTDGTESGEKQESRTPRWLPTVVCACVVALALVRTLPWTIRVIPVAEDDSWDLMLNLMAAQHALCGKDYIFTFGPLGFMYNKTYFPATFDAKLWLQTLFCGVTTVVMFFQGQRLFSNKLWTLPWLFCIMALYGFFGDVLFLAVPVLLINQYFLLDARDKMPSWESIVLVFLLALSAIVKFTFFVAAFWVMAFIAIDELFLKKSHKPILTATFFAVGLVAWLLAGQPIDTLFTYISSSLQVAAGHSEAMSAVDSPTWYLSVITAIAAIGVILIGFSKLAWQRLKAACIPAVLAESGLFF